MLNSVDATPDKNFIDARLIDLFGFHPWASGYNTSANGKV